MAVETHHFDQQVGAVGMVDRQYLPALYLLER